MSNAALACFTAAVCIVGGGYVFIVAARVYVRAKQLQEVWGLRIDSLSEHAWTLLRDRLSEEEFRQVLHHLAIYNAERVKGSKKLAITVVDAVRNTP